MSKDTELPSFSEVYLEIPLYQVIDLTSTDKQQAADFIKGVEKPDKTIDAYCIECKKTSTFDLQRFPSAPSITPSGEKRDETYRFLRDRYFSIELHCARNYTHTLQFFFRLKQMQLVKVGQYPSIASLSTFGIGQYRKILGEEKFKELSRAIGLTSHGVGIGAFVYLRRIFEYLIEEAHLQASQDSENWEEDVYQNARVDNKIQILKNYLPQFLVNNKHLYSILSKGIHSLTEEECLEHFDLVKVGIELILDERLEQQKKQDKINQAKKSLGKVYQNLKS